MNHPSKWARWMSRIVGDIATAVDDLRCWEEVQRMWTTNRSLRVPSDARDWIARMHAGSAALAVRRQLDRSRDSISLWKLLDDLERRARFMTLDNYLGEAEDPNLRAMLAQQAQAWIEPGTRHFDPAIAAADRQVLEHEGRLAREWANRAAAHADAKGPRKQVRYGDLADAVRAVEQLVLKYSPILTGDGYPGDTGLMSHRQFDESLIFRRPWRRARWRRRTWPERWAEREGEMEPGLDTLTVNSLSALFGARHSVRASLRSAWRWEEPTESPIRAVLESLGLPSTDAAVMWVRDRLLQRGERWDQ